MIYFPFMTKIILCVQLATRCSFKINQNMGFFNKKPFGGPRFFVPKRGAIEGWCGGGDSSFRVGGAVAWGAVGKGGMVRVVQLPATTYVVEWHPI